MVKHYKRVMAGRAEADKADGSGKAPSYSLEQLQLAKEYSKNHPKATPAELKSRIGLKSN